VCTEWFPTPIWRFTVASAPSLNAQLLAVIAAERAQDPAGLQRSTVLGWHSHDQLHQRPDLHAFVALLHQAIAEVGRDYRLDPQQARLDLATCWAIVNGPGASSVVHCHPNAFVSGVYYVQVGEGSGDIFFQDPRPAATVVACPVTAFTPWTIRQVTYRPHAGGMLLFPSWLYHGVGPNLSATPRVSVSFNFCLHWLAPP